ncbi:MAG: phosphoglycerate mutase family protein [Vicinamibacterales bacterium]
MRSFVVGAIFAAVLLTSGSAAAQQSVFVVRHAERADVGAPGTMGTDPDLSAVGKGRAESLASALRDAGITSIYVTEFKRTQQTASVIAKVLGIEPTVVPQGAGATLSEKLKTGAGNALVIGHSNTVPEVIKLLGVAEPVRVGDADYDNLFVVTMGSKPALLRLHYR